MNYDDNYDFLKGTNYMSGGMILHLYIAHVGFKVVVVSFFYATKIYELCMYHMYCCQEWLYLFQVNEHECPLVYEYCLWIRISYDMHDDCGLKVILSFR